LSIKIDVDSEKSLEKIIFSDETKIEIGNNRKVYVWRKVDERLRPECNGLYQGRTYKTKFSVMFWGCISYYGVGTLTPVVGNLNSEKYINILDDNLVFLPLQLRGKFSSDPRTRRLLRNLLIVLLFFPVISAIL
jgi:hypothetical protein